MATLEHRAADAAERIMSSIENERCVLKHDLVREILTTLRDAEASHPSLVEVSRLTAWFEWFRTRSKTIDALLKMAKTGGTEFATDWPPKDEDWPPTKLHTCEKHHKLDREYPPQPEEFPPSHYFSLAARLCKQGYRGHGHDAMKTDLEMMLVEGRLKQDEFDALILQHHFRHV